MKYYFNQVTTKIKALNMSCEPKNELEQVAYLNQKGKYKSTSERSSGRGNWI